jgi:hypothetical protein
LTAIERVIVALTATVRMQTNRVEMKALAHDFAQLFVTQPVCGFIVDLSDQVALLQSHLVSQALCLNINHINKKKRRLI